MNFLYLKRIYSSTNANYMMMDMGWLKMNLTMTDSSAASKFYSMNGTNSYITNYYLDPARTSRISTLFSNGLLVTSDKKLKKDIQTTSGLQTINQLRGVNFTWKKDNQKDLGVIAQEIEKVLPELVSTDSEGVKAVQYTSLIAPLIEAVKELSQQNDEQKAQIELLIQEVEALKK